MKWRRRLGDAFIKLEVEDEDFRAKLAQLHADFANTVMHLSMLMAQVSANLEMHEIDWENR